MDIVITGADSFIGKNLVPEFVKMNFRRIVTIDCLDDFPENFENADYFYHLYTEYRAIDENRFKIINVEFTKKILNLYKGKNFILISSTQAESNTAYGKSKLEAENAVIEWAKKTGNNYFILRLPNEFGKWCLPFSNSVVATFCHQLAHGEELTIKNHTTELKLAYIDDIISVLVKIIYSNQISGYLAIKPIYIITVGELAEILKDISSKQKTIILPNLNNELYWKLNSTYLSYLPETMVIKKCNMHIDFRGSFTELLRIEGFGQISVNITKPGITKGNHWHNSKTEKFFVVMGNALIRMRKLGDTTINEYKVSGNEITSTDILPGYIHNITNIGDNDLITVLWSNEIYNADFPDTYFEEV